MILGNFPHIPGRGKQCRRFGVARSNRYSDGGDGEEDRAQGEDRLCRVSGLNRCLHQSIGEKLGLEVTVPRNPQIVGALDAAFLAEQVERK